MPGFADMTESPRGRPGLGYFPAVDGLRAVAVLSVFLYHLRPGLLPGGFVGVDIFFVISGFVVTASLVHLRFDRLRSLLAYFYGRRIVRIVPALVVMLVATALLSVMFIPPSGYVLEARHTAIAGAFGTSNLQLALRDSGYFDPGQDLNPFLHTWTLGVEEQFYLLFPFFFFVYQRMVDDPRVSRRAALAVIAATALSLLTALWMHGENPRFGFYLMPTRFWELGCGMLLCLTIGRWRPRAAALPAWAAAAGFGGAIAALALTFAIPAGSQLPLRHLLAATAAGAGLIALVCARPEALPARVLAQPLPVYIGRISYSLYLWHWPVFVLFRWTIGLDGPLHAATASLIVFVLAIASYHFVEQPIRRGSAHVRRRAVVALGGFSLLACAAVVVLLFHWAPRLTQSRFALVGYPQMSAFEAGRSQEACAIEERSATLGGGLAQSWIPLCPQAGGVKLVVVGDSHARLFAASLRRYAAEGAVRVYSYSKYGCDFPSLALPASRKTYCSEFYDGVLAELERELAPGDTLLMASLHIPRIGAYWRAQPGDERVRKALERPQAVAEALGWMRRLSRTGATLVIQAPGPVFPSPPFRCSDWFNRRNPLCREGFTVARAELLALRQPALESMTRLADEVPNVRIWDPFPLLCPRDPCTPFRDGVALYLDVDHLGPMGHRLLYRQFRRAVGAGARPARRTTGVP
jgi:peptidoglycan/LPS O-acetylase OafA/YrhL